MGEDTKITYVYMLYNGPNIKIAVDQELPPIGNKMYEFKINGWYMELKNVKQRLSVVR